MVLVLESEEVELLGRLVATAVEVLGAVVRLRRSAAAAVAAEKMLVLAMRVAHFAELWEALEVLEARKMLAGSRPAGPGQLELESGHAPGWSLRRLGLDLQFGPWPDCPP